LVPHLKNISQIGSFLENRKIFETTTWKKTASIPVPLVAQTHLTKIRSSDSILSFMMAITSLAKKWDHQ